MESLEDILNSKKNSGLIITETAINFRGLFFTVARQAVYVCLTLALVYLTVSYAPRQNNFVLLKNANVQIVKEGSGKFLLSNQNGEKEVAQDYQIQAGDTLKTFNDVIATITSESGSLMRIDENSEVKVLKLEKSNFGNNIALQVLTGRVWINNFNFRDTFNVSSDFVVTSPEGARYSFEYRSTKKEVEVFTEEGPIKVSFISKKVLPNAIRSEIVASLYLNQIILPPGNKIVVKESSITENFLQAKYLKLLKNVKIGHVEKEVGSWHDYNKKKDDVYLSALIKAQKEIILSRSDSIDQDISSDWFSSLKQKLIIFPLKKKLDLKEHFLSLFYGSERKIWEGSLSFDKNNFAQISKVFEELKLLLSEDELRALLSDLTEEYFRMFFATSDMPLSKFRSELKEMIGKELLKGPALGLFSLREMHEIMSEIKQKMENLSLVNIKIAKDKFDKYAILLNKHLGLNTFSKLENPVNYLIQERHLLFDLLTFYPEFYDFELFKIVSLLEDQIVFYSKEIVDEDDNRLYFRAENLDFYGDLVSALKRNVGIRYKILALGKYIGERNLSLMPPGIQKVDDHPLSIQKRDEFILILDFMNSAFFKKEFNADAYKAYLDDLKYEKEYTASEEKKVKRRNAAPTSAEQIKKIEVIFSSQGYKVSEIESLGDQRNVLFSLGKVVVKGKSIKGKYNVEGNYMYDIEIDNELKKGEVYLSLLPEVLLSNQESKENIQSSSEENKKSNLSNSERLAINKVIDDLKAAGIIVRQTDDVAIISLEKHQFSMEKAFISNDINQIELSFRYLEDKKQGDNLKVKMETGAMSQEKGVYNLSELKRKTIELYEERR